MAGAYTIEDVVDVVIVLSGRSITRAGFETALWVSEDVPFAERVKTYTNVTDLATDGFDTESKTYKALQTIFQGTFRPREVKVGRREELEDMTDTLTAIDNFDSDFYYILIESDEVADVLDAAAYAEASDSLNRMFVKTVKDADVLTNVDTDVLSQLQALSYQNSHISFGKIADEFIDAAIVGADADVIPGSQTLFAKTLKGVSQGTVASELSRDEGNTVLEKGGNIYTRIAGLGFYKDGKNVSGDFYDLVRGMHYTEARLEEAVFLLLKQASDAGSKIPYTELGMEMVVQTMESSLDRRVQDGFLDSYTVTPPSLEDIAEADKLGRLLPDLPFEGRLSGAFHNIKIRGFLTVA